MRAKRRYVCRHPHTRTLSDGLSMRVEWCARCGSARRIYLSSKGPKPWMRPTRTRLMERAA